MQKRILLTLALAIAMVFGPSVRGTAKTERQTTIKVLSVGNSFSSDAVSDYLYDLGQAQGVEFVLESVSVGGCPLEKHWNYASQGHVYNVSKCEGGEWTKMKATLTQALEDEDWDFITFQQSSPLSGQWDSFEPWLGNLVGLARKTAGPKAVICFQQTWAYAKDATHPKFVNYGRDQDRMYAAIIEAEKLACEKYDLKVIPSGTAIQNGRRTLLGQDFVRDGYHMSYTNGRFTVACTWLETFTGKDVTLNTLRPSWLQPLQTEICKGIAHAAVQNPWEVTVLDKYLRKREKVNYDRSTLPEYALPDPLVMEDGTPVRNRRQWEKARRPQLLELFTTQMFGRVPENRISGISWEVAESGEAFGGKALRKQIKFTFEDVMHNNKGKARTMMLLLYTPKNAPKGGSPVFLGVNFYGNHAVCNDPEIISPEENKGQYGIYQERERGSVASRWCVEDIISRGYGLATFFRSDISPDYDSFTKSVVGFYRDADKEKYGTDDSWGSIAAWAWGLSLAMDYLQKDADVDGSKVAVIGHSRMGKTALWAGARDTRFAMVISNDSGCGGAALSRRKIGETVKIINTHFPHWFCRNFKQYNDNEGALPFDQHELLSLVAPRPLYVASSSNDLWADPEGEKASLEEARKVYKFLGAGDKTGYHIKEGKHSITSEDWAHYLDFADRFLR